MPIYDHIPVSRSEYIFRCGANYLEARQILNDNQQEVKSGKVKLRFHVPATSSGRLTNYRLYPGPKVKKGAASWLEGFAKPVLTHHRSGKNIELGTADPIGRVRTSKYIQLVSDDLWMNDAKAPLQDGSGFIDVGADITDQEAIEKVLDQRYLTVSVGFDTVSMSCSICGKDWKGMSPCDHPLGRVISLTDAKSTEKRKALVYLITGDMTYEELSFVNRPANALSAVSGFEFLQDSALDLPYTPLPTSNLCFDSLEVGTMLYDAVEPKDKEVVEVKEVPVEGGATKSLTVVGNDALKQMVSEEVVKTGNVSLNYSAATENAVSKIEDRIMAEDTKVEDVKPSEGPAPVDQAVKALEDTLKAKDVEIKALREENTKLAVEVQRSMARRLLDLRVATSDPTADGVKGNPEKYEAVVADLAKRSRLSLEDSIRDEEFRTVALASKPKPIEVKDIPRGSITPKDVGIMVDTKKDEVKNTVDSKESRVVPNPDNYKSGVRERLKSLTKGGK